jgi:phage shock protein A
MSLIQNVSDKALYFKTKSAQLDARVIDLQSEIDVLRQDLNERNAEIEQLKLKRQVQNTSQDVTSHVPVDMNARIDELVREIDACLMHLKR